MLHPFPTLLKNKLLTIFPSTFPEKSRPQSQNGSKWYTMFSNPSENCKQPPLFIPLDQSFQPPKWQNCLCSGNPGVLLTSNLGSHVWTLVAPGQDSNIQGYIYIWSLLIIADLIRTWWQPLMMIPSCRAMFISIYNIQIHQQLQPNHLPNSNKTATKQIFDV